MSDTHAQSGSEPGPAPSEPPPSSEPPPGQPRDSLLLLVALLAVATAYVTSLGGQLVWDDIRLIRESPDIQALDLRNAFLRPFWCGAPGEPGSTAFYRPLTVLLFGLDYKIHGENPTGFHLTNLVLHLVVTGVLFKLLRRGGISSGLSLGLAMLWGLLPRLTEGVAWISGRGDVLAGTFGICALLVYRPGSRARLAMASMLALLAMLSKEAALGVFAALLVLEATRSREGQARARRLQDLAIVLGFLAVYAGLRVTAEAVPDHGGLRLTLVQRVLGTLESAGRYLVMLLNPFQPQTFIGELGRPDWRFVPLGVVGLLGAGYALWRNRRSAILGYLLVGLVPLALVIHIWPLPVAVVASDRYLYLPTLGLILALAPRLQAWQSVSRVPMVASLALVVACWVATRQRVSEYADEVDFWIAARQSSPEAMTPLTELGGAAYRAGCFPEAWELYMQALKIPRLGSERALENSALLANLLGRREQATRLADALLRRYPNVASFEVRRAMVALAADDLETARSHTERAIRLDPKFVAARKMLVAVHRVHDQWPRVVAGEASDSERLRLEMVALRYPESLATLRRMLQDPAADDAAIRAGVQFVVLEGPPSDAQDVVGTYIAKRRPADAEMLKAGLKLRVDRAAEVRQKLWEFGVAPGKG